MSNGGIEQAEGIEQALEEALKIELKAITEDNPSPLERLLAHSRTGIYSFICDIEEIHEWARGHIRYLRKAVRLIGQRRQEYSRSPGLHVLLTERRYEGSGRKSLRKLQNRAIQHSRYALFDLSTLWDLTVKAAYGFYKRGLPLESLSFFDVLRELGDERGLDYFFRTAGIIFRDGRPIIRRDSPLNYLRDSRNAKSHSISGIIVASDRGIYAEEDRAVNIELLTEGGGKEQVRVPPLGRELEMAAGAYVNFVESYNALFSIMNRKARQGWRL